MRRHDTASADDAPSSYTPWAPTLGQRVRVRISPECKYHDRPVFHVDGVDMTGNGETGVVIDNLVASNPRFIITEYTPGTLEDSIRNGHVWYIGLDRVIGRSEQGERVNATRVAASELEPVDDDEDD